MVIIYKYSSFFGFGSPTNICLPGESSGLLRPLKTWSKVDVAMISFGQGIAVTPLQMACAVSAIANNGILLQPRLVKSISHSNGKTVKGITKKRRDNYFSRHSGGIKNKKKALAKEIRKSKGLYNAKILSHKYLW